MSTVHIHTYTDGNRMKHMCCLVTGLAALLHMSNPHVVVMVVLCDFLLEC